MKLNITCSDVVGKAILSMMAAVQACAPDEVITCDIATGEVKEPKARVKYVAVGLPVGSSDEAVMEFLKDKLEAVGEHTIQGIVLTDVAKGTAADEVVTERGIRESRHFNSKSVQRSLVQLRDAGLVKSVPLS